MFELQLKSCSHRHILQFSLKDKGETDDTFQQIWQDRRFNIYTSKENFGVV